MEFWEMDDRREHRLRANSIQGRGTDFVGGIDNDALDFSQLEDFINSEGSQGNGTYFGESLNSTTAAPSGGKLLNVIVENNKRNASGHSLPESPPDSSSEHPYSPQEGCEPPLNASDAIYTTLGQAIYKPLNPMISADGNLILGSHIVVSDTQNGGEHLIQVGQPDAAGSLLGDRLIMQEAVEAQHHVGRQGTQQQPQILLTTANPPGQQEQQSFGGERSLQDYGGYTATTLQDSGGICAGERGSSLESLQTVYTNLQNVPKKRKLSQDHSPLVKSEPDHNSASQLSPPGPLSSSLDDDYASSEACLSESQYQCIKFNAFQQAQWHALCDQNLTELPIPHYRVDADKGFNFSNADDAFVCQKKNHFQITCHVQLLGDAQFVKTPDGFQKISSFHIHFYGVKHDCPTQTIRVEQSQSDRSKKAFHPVLVELVNSQVTKVTVGRLHFSETTSNNMRKKGKPNPEQRYFQLVVGLHAHTTTGNFPVISHASQKIIVRASNPGQFESDVELCWQKGQTQDSICHSGKVGINTDRPDESLVVHGNIKVTGHIVQPSDVRAKKNIVEVDSAEQLRNVQKLRVVRYDYEPTFASQLSRDSHRSDTGVIAQEVAKVLPEAVRPAGDLVLENGTSIDNFLVVNKERIFMENIGAVKELCRVTDNLETRIDQLERINRRLNKLKRGDSLKSTSTVSSFRNSQSQHQKCSRHHSCHKNGDEELCSNKFIQIIIVVLVLIMAFCLAAITTLYLMEASRHSQFARTSLQPTHKNIATATKRPPGKSSKGFAPGWHTVAPYYTTDSSIDEDITRITVDPKLIRRLTHNIGRPDDCVSLEQDLENVNLCHIFCCAAAPPVIPPEPGSARNYPDKVPRNRSQAPTLLNIEKNNKISKPFHSNDIDKQMRQKRDAFDLTDDVNSFDAPGEDYEQMFSIVVQGRNFNATLTHSYLSQDAKIYNYTYDVPISKYMPDEFVNLIFRSTQANIKEIEHCYNDHNKQAECPSFGTSHIYYEDKPQTRHKVNENSPSQLVSSQSIIFEVDMADYQSKVMTYRASLRQTQGTCKLSSTKLGLEFVEYNIHFFRQCDE